MTDTSYLLQYFLEHSPKDTSVKKIKVTRKKPLLDKESETEGKKHE